MIIDHSSAEGPDIHLRLEFRAPRDKVYRTWTDAGLIRKWYYPGPGFRCYVAETDLRALGGWRIGMTDDAEIDTVVRGHFIEVVPGERLSYTWTGACAQEQYWTLVTARFVDREQGSAIELTHGVFADEQDRAAHEMGWMGCLQHLAQELGE